MQVHIVAFSIILLILKSIIQILQPTIVECNSKHLYKVDILEYFISNFSPFEQIFSLKCSFALTSNALNITEK